MISQFLCEIVKGTTRFRILALSNYLSRIATESDQLTNDRVFVEQLKNFAEPEDVVMGLSAGGDSPSVMNAIEYASCIGCRTISVTAGDGGQLAEMAELNVHVPATHTGSIEDAHMIICHMIAYYFVDSEKNQATVSTGA
jgi:D-sedoheptulose 7-phosphate isomerase